MNNYETLFVIKPTLTEEETAKQIESVQNSVKELGGEVVATNDMGLRKLAYEIDKNPRGHYVVVYHKSPTNAIAEIERRLRYNEEVLKFFTVKYTNKKEIASFEQQVASCNKDSKEEASSEA